MTRSILPPFVPAAALCWSLGLPAPLLEAQDAPVRIRTYEAPRAFTFTTPDPNRAALGLGLSTGSLADTAGLEVVEVTPDGPAAKAGLAVGARLEAINGVSLRISADDAADPLTADIGYRRLQRELEKVSAGDAVRLEVRSGGQRRTVSVTTVAARELDRARVATLRSELETLRDDVERVRSGRVEAARVSRAERASLGLTLASAGNARDTLGVFVTAVTTGGPADRAGLMEGERIASITGVDLRVPAGDVGDPMAGQARISRLLRELEKATPGSEVALRVYGNGRLRDVRVTTGKASEWGGGSRFEFRTGPGSAARVAVPELLGRIERITPGAAIRLSPEGLSRRAPGAEVRVLPRTPAGGVRRVEVRSSEPAGGLRRIEVRPSEPAGGLRRIEVAPTRPVAPRATVRRVVLTV